MYLRIQGFMDETPKDEPCAQKTERFTLHGSHGKQRDELSAKLLLLWAYVDNQDIWFEFLRHGHLDYPEWIRELTVDEFNFNGALSDHGLVEVDKFRGNGGYDIRGRGLCFEPRVI